MWLLMINPDEIKQKKYSVERIEICTPALAVTSLLLEAEVRVHFHFVYCCFKWKDKGKIILCLY